MQSVDQMSEHANFSVAMPPHDALNAAFAAMPRKNRVVCIPYADGIDIQTVKHTPAWALAALLIAPIGLVLMLTVRVTRHARLTATATPDGGSVLHVRGPLDTKAAIILRNMRTA